MKTVECCVVSTANDWLSLPETSDNVAIIGGHFSDDVDQRELQHAIENLPVANVYGPQICFQRAGY
jgi:hypothetical protein